MHQQRSMLGLSPFCRLLFTTCVMSNVFVSVTIGIGDDIHRSKASLRLLSSGDTGCFIVAAFKCWLLIPEWSSENEIPQLFTLSLLLSIQSVSKLPTGLVGIDFVLLVHPFHGLLCKKQERCRVFLVLLSIQSVSKLPTGYKAKQENFSSLVSCGEGGIRTPGTSQYVGFQDRCNRPLCHLSKGFFYVKECGLSRLTMQNYIIFFMCASKMGKI